MIRDKYLLFSGPIRVWISDRHEVVVSIGIDQRPSEDVVLKTLLRKAILTRFPGQNVEDMLDAVIREPIAIIENDEYGTQCGVILKRVGIPESA